MSFHKAVSRSRRVLVAGVVAVCLSSGCSRPVVGDVAGPQPPPSTDEATTAHGPGADPRLVALQPCDLLSTADAAKFGLADAKEEELVGIRSCAYRYTGDSIATSFTVSVDIFSTLGLERLYVPEKRPSPDIGTHKALWFTDRTGICGLALGVSDNSRVDVTAVGGEHEMACQLVHKVAVAVEPNLP